MRSPSRQADEHDPVHAARPRPCRRRSRASGRAWSGGRGRSACSSGRRSPTSSASIARPRARWKRTPASATRRRSCCDLLALVALQPGQQRVEVGDRVSRVLRPVELHAFAHQAAGGGERAGVVGLGEQHVQRRQVRLAASATRACASASRAGASAGQQARAGHRRERHRDQQLGVVGQSVALVGVGPGPVEDVLAVGMGLQVQRAGGDQLAAAVASVTKRGDQPVAGTALPESCSAARYSWRMKGVGAACVAEQIVPGRGVDRRRRLVDPDDIIIRSDVTLPRSWTSRCEPLAESGAGPDQRHRRRPGRQRAAHRRRGPPGACPGGARRADARAGAVGLSAGRPAAAPVLRARLRSRRCTRLAEELADCDGLHVVVGHPHQFGERGDVRSKSHAVPQRFNAASVLTGGRVLATYCKRELPNYQVFDERRYFASGRDVGQPPVVFEVGGLRLGLLICEDAWFDEPAQCRARRRCADAVRPQRLALPRRQGAPSASSAWPSAPARSACRLLYSHLVGGQDEVVFDGASFAIDAGGVVHARALDLRRGAAGRRHRRRPAAAGRTACDSRRRRPGLVRAGHRRARLHRQERLSRRDHRPVRRHRLGPGAGGRRRRARCRPGARRDDAFALHGRHLLDRCARHGRAAGRALRRDPDRADVRCLPRQPGRGVRRPGPRTRPKKTCRRASAARC